MMKTVFRGPDERRVLEGSQTYGAGQSDPTGAKGIPSRWKRNGEKGNYRFFFFAAFFFFAFLAFFAITALLGVAFVDREGGRKGGHRS
ncbi:MAG TPA: hypothetical protein VEU47_16585 [Candidatus Cybelea sp.]|nr:hypothetical protein [Candidatus Cybelea sp.]